MNQPPTWNPGMHGHVFSIYLGRIPKEQRARVLQSLAESQKRIVPLTVDNSRVIPMTFDDGI